MVWNVFYKLLTTSQNFYSTKLNYQQYVNEPSSIPSFNGDFIVLNRMVPNSNPFSYGIYYIFYQCVHNIKSTE